jgi:exosortase
MWATEHYSFFPLILIGAAILGWQRYRKYQESVRGAVWDVRFRAAGCWVLSLLLLAGAVSRHTPWLGGVGAMFAVRAAIRSLFVPELARRLLPAWWFLWLAIPLPLNFDRQLIVSLQRLASVIASGVLDLIGYRHTISGVVLRFPQKSFLVEDACSGIQSLYAAISVTVFYSLLGERGFWRTFVLVLLGVVWVLMANAARIVTVAVVSTQFGVPIDQGWAHEAVGVVVFVTALLMIVSTDRLILFVAPPRRPDPFQRERPRRKGWWPFSSHSGRHLTESWGLAWSLPATLLAIGLFGALALVQWTQAAGQATPNFQVLEREGDNFQETVLPAEASGWQRDKFTIVHREPDDPNGQISRIWWFTRDGQTVAISVDGPFNTWHDLGLCYESQGWTITEERDYRGPEPDAALVYSTLQQENADGRYAFVAFTAFDETGRSISPPPLVRWGLGQRFPETGILLRRLKDALTGVAGGTAAEQYFGTVFQVQVYAESYSLLTSAERTAVQALFQQMAAVLRDHLTMHARAAVDETAAGTQ